VSAEFVERMVESYSQVHNERFWREIQPFVESRVTTDSTVLDLGCGPGLHIKEINRRYNPRKLIGIDHNQLMFDRAEKFIADFRDKVEFIKQHFQENPNLPKGNDAIFSSRVLRSFEDQYTSLRNIHKALNPDGLLVLLDWARADLPTYAEYLGGEPSDVMKYHRNFSRYSLNDWEYILSNTGFRVELAFSLPPVHLAIVARKIENTSITLD